LSRVNTEISGKIPDFSKNHRGHKEKMKKEQKEQEKTT